jgi:hypothetical protein
MIRLQPHMYSCLLLCVMFPYFAKCIRRVALNVGRT